MELHDIVAVWCAISNPPVQGAVPEGSCGLNGDWVARKRVFDIERQVDDDWLLGLCGAHDIQQ